MAEILAELEAAEASDGDRRYHVDRAMSRLVGLREREAEAGPASPERTAEFRLRFPEILVRLGNAVPAYVLRAADRAESVNDEAGLYDVALRRSGIQELLDQFPDTPAAALVDRDEVAELDGDLRRVAEDLGPLPQRMVPRAAPGHHWWWRHPEA